MAVSSELAKAFQLNVRIQNLDAFHKDAIWPHRVDICITRIPIRKKDGYDPSMITSLAARLKNCMAKNGIVFLVCYAPSENKARPFEIAKAMTDIGFTHIDNIIIEKSWYPGKRSEANLVNSHEYVLHFCNGDVWSLDRLPIREYLGTETEVSCPGNTWQVNTGSLDESISVDLAELLLRLTDSLPGSIVFDPFLGNQATMAAALKLGHGFTGFEKDAKKMKKYQAFLNKQTLTIDGQAVYSSKEVINDIPKI